MSAGVAPVATTRTRYSERKRNSSTWLSPSNDSKRTPNEVRPLA